MRFQQNNIPIIGDQALWLWMIAFTAYTWDVTQTSIKTTDTTLRILSL